MRCTVALASLLVLAPALPGQAQEQYYVTPSAGSTTQRFGAALAVSGDLFLAGAPFNDTNGSDSGAAFVFRYDAATDAWIEMQQLFASDPESSARFGTSVAIDGDLLVVGAPLKDKSTTSTNTGAIYVFRFDATAGTWSEEQKLVASNATANDQFGSAVGVSAATGVVVAGAPLANTAMGADSGAAFVFRYQNSTVKWIEETQLLDPDGAASDHAGVAVAIEGTTVLVGSPLSLENGFHDAGSVGVWSFDGVQWNQDQELLASVMKTSNQFGTALDLAGDQMAVGAPLEDASSTILNSGAAYLFRRSAGTWSEEARLLPPVPDPSAQFGGSVAVLDKLAVVGVELEDVNGLNDAGASWTFRFNSKKKQWFADQQLSASDVAAADHLGAQVALHATQILSAAEFNNTAAGGDWGVVYGYDHREIVLDIDPSDPQPDETITFTAFRGDPGQIVMITIEEVAGAPFFLPLLLLPFSADHALTFTADAPNPAFGVRVGMRAYKVSPTGPVVFSELAYVDV